VCIVPDGLRILFRTVSCDFRQLHERTLVEGIMKEARRDVVERIWEGSILKARRELKMPRSKSRSLIPIQETRSSSSIRR